MNIRYLALTFLLPVLAACGGGEPGAPTTSAETAGGSAARYQEGVHYERLAEPFEAPVNEVVEVFSYGCPACANFQGEVDTWKRERGDAVTLRYVPAVFQPAWEPFARAFHAAQELGALSRLHRAIFAGMMRPTGPARTIADIADIVAGAGIDRQRFLDTAQSAAVTERMAQSNAYVRQAGIRSTPTLVVSGRYRVQRDLPNNLSPLTVADWLIEQQP